MPEMNTRGNRFRNSRLAASITALVPGAAPSSIDIADDTIRGRLGEYRWLDEGEIRNALEAFLNSRLSTEEVRILIEKYGLLTSARTTEGGPFEEALSLWRMKQKWLRDFWATLRGHGGWSQMRGDHVAMTIGPEEVILRFMALSDALEAALNALPAKRMGICKSPDCASPYFIKQRPTENYCGTAACITYGQRLAKRSWWAKNKKGSATRGRAK